MALTSRALVGGLDPACRLVCLAILSPAAILATWPTALVLASTFLCLLLLGGLRVSSLLRESAFVLAFAAAVPALGALAPQGGASGARESAIEAGQYGLRLIAAFWAGRLFFASTSLSELRDAATRLARLLPLPRRIDIGLALSLVIGFMPRIVAEWRESLAAARSRGLSRRPRPDLLARFLAAFLRRLMLDAVAVPQALYARGWSPERGLSPLRWRGRDSICLAASVLVLAGAALRLV